MTGPAGTTAWRVARRMARASAPLVGGYWAIMFPVCAATIAAGLMLGDLDVSIWAASGAAAPKYFMLALGTLLAAALPIYVGNGITRRDFALGATAYLLMIAAGYGTLMALGYAVERPIYAANGLLSRLSEPYPVQSFGDGLAVWVEDLLVGVVYLCAGWLIGATFYRLGVWWGLAVIPAAAVPIAVVETAFDSLWLGYGINNGLATEPPVLAVGVLLGLAAAAVAWTAAYALVRAVPIRKVSG